MQSDNFNSYDLINLLLLIAIQFQIHVFLDPDPVILMLFVKAMKYWKTTSHVDVYFLSLEMFSFAQVSFG